MEINQRLLEQVQVLKAQLGDDKAFESLYHIYHLRVLYYLRRLVNHEQTADDIAQTVWYEVFCRLTELRSTQAFSVWLYRIAHNQTMEYWRKNKHYVLTNNIEEFDHSEIGNGFETSFEIENGKMLHQALKSLSAEHKEVLVLHYLEEMSYQETAEVTGLPIGTVRSRIYHAKQKLKTIIKEWKHEES